MVRSRPSSLVRHAEPRQHKASLPTSAPTPAVAVLQSRQPADHGTTAGEIMASWKVARGRARNISGTGGTIVRPLDNGSACARLICRRRAHVDIEPDEARRLAPSNEQRSDVRLA
jgi:hypothetical protein